MNRKINILAHTALVVSIVLFIVSLAIMIYDSKYHFLFQFNEMSSVITIMSFSVALFYFYVGVKFGEKN